MPNKGNILLVANWDSNVGYAWWLMENFWTTIATHFKGHGIKSHLIYPSITQLPKSIASSSIEVKECDFKNHNLKNLYKLHNLIKTNNIKFIYLTDSRFYSFFYILLRFWGIRRIVVHDHTPGERTKPTSWRKFLKFIIQRIPFYTADHFIAVTEFVYQRHIEVNCIPPNKCSIANNGINPIDLKSANKYYAHEAFNIPKDKRIIVTTGRASYYKGIDFFIECANILINKEGHQNLHFLFCGDGPNMNDFQQLAKNLKIAGNFTFAGKRTDIRLILPSCSYGFHAATGEVGYSLSILEYMSAGLITIIPDNPSVSLATIDMKNGVLYKTRDHKSAINAIKTAMNNEITQTIRQSAIQTIRDEFTIKNTNKQLINILTSVFS